MDAVSPLLLAIAVVSTATLSGVFGMGGGMALMLVYATLMPAPEAMVLHGVTQAASNGSRTVLLLPHTRWRIFAAYAVGALLALALASLVQITPSRGLLLIGLGTIPLVVTVIPQRWVPSVERPAAAGACGMVATAAQLTAGVSGPLLDAFFFRTSMDRHGIVATKAVTQTLGHLLKLVYFGALIGFTELPFATMAVVILAATAGSACGRAILGRLGETSFRRAGRTLVAVIAVVALVRGISELT